MKEITEKQKNGGRRTAAVLARIALFVVIITVCSWTSIPYVVPFTLQTFAVFFVLVLLGGKYGTAAITVYVVMGAVGVPVFSGFKGGFGALAGVTGGYIFGFVLSGLVYWALPFKEKNCVLKILACFIALLFCYACGSLWFWFVSEGALSAEGLLHALSVCVLPYIAVDIIKIILAVLLGVKLKKLING